MWDEELEKVSTEEQREEVREALSTAADWLETDGTDVSTKEYVYVPPCCYLTFWLMPTWLVETRRRSLRSLQTPYLNAKKNSPSALFKLLCSLT
jgi:hypothetical protein